MRLEELGKLKKSNYLIGSQTCDLPACSIMSQSTTILFFFFFVNPLLFESCTDIFSKRCEITRGMKRSAQ
jgi:hypothetical protein